MGTFNAGITMRSYLFRKRQFLYKTFGQLGFFCLAYVFHLHAGNKYFETGMQVINVETHMKIMYAIKKFICKPY